MLSSRWAIIQNFNTVYDESGENQLLSSIVNNNVRRFKRVLSRTKNPHLQKCEHGDYGLHYAARYGLTNFIYLLLRSGGDINIKNENGNTPLHIAVHYFQVNSVKALRLLGADLTITNNDGLTALDLAQNHHELIHITPRIIFLLTTEFAVVEIAAGEE